MSRIAKAPVVVPNDVEIKINAQAITVKGKKGELSRTINSAVNLAFEDNQLTFSPKTESANAWMLAGTERALVNSMVIGVTEGFTKKLQLVGVGFRAQAQGDNINLNLGFSHPIQYKMPAGVKVECPTQTEIVLTGIDKQLVGQVAANIRAYRKPEPYKGKGVRYSDEVIRMKEAKKK